MPSPASISIPTKAAFLQRGATLCMATHDTRFAQYAQRTVHLFDGRIVSEEEARKQHVP